MSFDEKRHLYDDKNRLRSTIHDDGSSTTNAYSCCRLLWSQDRTGSNLECGYVYYTSALSDATT